MKKNPRVVSKPWGSELIWAETSDYLGKILRVNAGEALSLPITAATAEYAARIPTGSNLMNSPTVEADANGEPYLMTYWSPAGASVPCFQIVHREAGAWRVTPVDYPLPAFTLAGGGTKRPPVSRGILLLGSSRRPTATLVFRDDANGGAVIAVSGKFPSAETWVSTRLTEGSAGAWEPSYDPEPWRRQSRLEMLVQHVEQRDGNDSQPAQAPAEPIGVLSWSPNN